MDVMGKKPLNEEGTELEALTGATTSPREADQSSPRLGRELSGKFPSAPSLLSAVKWPQLGVAFCFFFAILHLAQDLELLGVPVPAARRCLVSIVLPLNTELSFQYLQMIWCYQAMLVCISTLWV